MSDNKNGLTEIEKDFIRQNIGEFSPFKLAQALNRSDATVWRFAQTIKSYRERVKKKMKRSNNDRYSIVTKFERPPDHYSNHSPYRIASPGLLKP